MGRSCQVIITRRFFKGRLIRVSGVAPKGKERKEKKENNQNKECTRRSKGPRDGVAKNLLPRQWGTENIERVFTYRPKRRDDVPEGKYLKLGTRLSTELSISFSGFRMDTTSTLTKGLKLEVSYSSSTS